MYKVYTSYTSNKKVQKLEGFKIIIANRIYCWNGYSEHYSELAPDIKWVDYIHNQLKLTQEHKDRFTKAYIEKLDSLKQNNTLDRYVEDINKRLERLERFIYNIQKYLINLDGDDEE